MADTLILMECKSTILSAQAKFSGDFRRFYGNIKSAKKVLNNYGMPSDDWGTYIKAKEILLKK